jgi:hypothetical protein
MQIEAKRNMNMLKRSLGFSVMIFLITPCLVFAASRTTLPQSQTQVPEILNAEQTTAVDGFNKAMLALSLSSRTKSSQVAELNQVRLAIESLERAKVGFTRNRKPQLSDSQLIQISHDLERQVKKGPQAANVNRVDFAPAVSSVMICLPLLLAKCNAWAYQKGREMTAPAADRFMRQMLAPGTGDAK